MGWPNFTRHSVSESDISKLQESPCQLSLSSMKTVQVTSFDHTSRRHNYDHEHVFHPRLNAMLSFPGARGVSYAKQTLNPKVKSSQPAVPNPKPSNPHIPPFQPHPTPHYNPAKPNPSRTTSPETKASHERNLQNRQTKHAPSPPSRNRGRMTYHPVHAPVEEGCPIEGSRMNRNTCAERLSAVCCLSDAMVPRVP